MSPMPTPEWEEQIQARLRRERRGIREDHASDRRDDTAGAAAGAGVRLPDSHLLDVTPVATKSEREFVALWRDFAHKISRWYARAKR